MKYILFHEELLLDSAYNVCSSELGKKEQFNILYWWKLLTVVVSLTETVYSQLYD